MKVFSTTITFSVVAYRALSYTIPKTRFGFSFYTALFSTKQEKLDVKIESKIPVTILSGFLGSGKTSFLQKLVNSNENSKNRIGLVVNDMAAVNIDAKQIKQKTLGTFDGIDTMELQNGCVCCTLAEDLLASVTRLVTLSDLKGYKYDHIIVECSGIAEPRKIRDLFQEAEDFGNTNFWNDKRKTFKVYKVVVNADEIHPGYWASLVNNHPIEILYKKRNI